MVGVIVFPGSNCDHDCYHVIKHVFNMPVRFVWHKETGIGHDVKALILPGGFSHGDYLRSGALARFSPIIEAVRDFAAKGKPVLGICNGFQILLEAGLLPGAMLRNRNLKFICKNVYVRVENTDTPFTGRFSRSDVLKIPIAHAEGNYYADPPVLEDLKSRGGIVFRYCDKNGNVCQEANPNGSLDSIAGILNPEGNVLGMMPHPERCAEEVLGNEDGERLFRSLAEFVS